MENSLDISSKRRSKGKLVYLLSLMRPANVITSASNILAGIAISGSFEFGSYLEWPSFIGESSYDIVCLIFSTCMLYAGGVVFNDVFDFSIDKMERPERALPSGKVSIKEASIVGSFLFLIGISFAFAVNYYSGTIACLIVLLALSYNYKSKHYKIGGPFTMGLCRAFNLCLGISILPESLYLNYWYSVIPLCYILAVTLISHGEVNGGNRISLRLAMLLYLCMFILILYVQPASFPFVLVWAFITIIPLLKAIKNQEAMAQRKAVKAGVLAVILMDASIAAGFTGFYYSLIIVLLLPVSLLISKKFSVT